MKKQMQKPKKRDGSPRGKEKLHGKEKIAKSDEAVQTGTKQGAEQTSLAELLAGMLHAGAGAMNDASVTVKTVRIDEHGHIVDEHVMEKAVASSDEGSSVVTDKGATMRRTKPHQAGRRKKRQQSAAIDLWEGIMGDPDDMDEVAES